MIFLLLQLTTQNPNGFYNYNFGSKIISLYTDFSDSNNIWIRLNYKINTNVFGTSIDINFSSDMVDDLFLNSESFGWSDNLYTIKTENSWIVKNVKFHQRYLNSSLLSYYFANFFNGKTPTNTIWTQDYNDGYLLWSGNFSTFGTWTTMYYGCGEYININEYISFRSGGDNGQWKGHNNGEYIHHKCNDYTSSYNSLTSMLDWNTNRITWAKLKKEMFFTQPKSFENRILFFLINFVL